MITAEGVTVRHRGAHADALTGVDVTVPETGVLGIVGPNGSGKSTLLATLQGRLAPRRGRVLLDGVDVRSLPRRVLARRIGLVAQEETVEGRLAVRELVLLGRLPHQGLLAGVGAHDEDAVERALERTDLTALASRDLATLSGGESRRAMIARGLAQEAAHLLLDEPTNHLDAHHRHRVLALLANLPGTVVVLHDLDLALRYCDDVLVLDAGRVVAAGPAARTLTPTVLDPVYGARHEVIRDSAGRAHLIVTDAPQGPPRWPPPSTTPGEIVGD